LHFPVTRGEDAPRMDRLNGKAAIVTGGAKGIGSVISEHLARDGADVVLVGRDADAVQAHAALLNEKYPDRRSLAIACDVTGEEQVRAMIATAVERFGGIDFLINAAGGTGPIETPAQDYDVEDFRAILELNVIGTFLPIKHAIPHLIGRGGGRIVNLSGTSGLRGYPNRSGYSSSKWAVRGLTRTLALELGPHDITVNDVCPNVTHGARMDRIVAMKASKVGKAPEEVYADFASQTALGRFVEEEDIAAAIDFLVSEGAKNITGHDIPVDAGWDV
jgi:NAD(P)-dependent dehydrogenase (short-subunit alcohol dehydrogenase family)